jgi:hypothetical protein
MNSVVWEIGENMLQASSDDITDDTDKEQRLGQGQGQGQESSGREGEETEGMRESQRERGDGDDLTMTMMSHPVSVSNPAVTVNEEFMRPLPPTTPPTAAMSERQSKAETETQQTGRERETVRTSARKVEESKETKEKEGEEQEQGLPPMIWQRAEYTEADIAFLQSLRESGQIPDTALLPRSMSDIRRTHTSPSLRMRPDEHQENQETEQEERMREIATKGPLHIKSEDEEVELDEIRDNERVQQEWFVCW